MVTIEGSSLNSYLSPTLRRRGRLNGRTRRGVVFRFNERARSARVKIRTIIAKPLCLAIPCVTDTGARGEGN